MRVYDNYYIYAIKHNATGKLYIGCTKTKSRVKNHFSSLKKGKHTNEAMQKDCDEYGYKYTAYLLEILNRVQDADTDPHEREAFWIHYYGTDDPEKGYNSPKHYRRLDITSFPIIKSTEDIQVRLD